MKIPAPPVGRKPTALAAIYSAHRTNHLLHGGWRAELKLAGIDCYVIELLAMC